MLNIFYLRDGNNFENVIYVISFKCSKIAWDFKKFSKCRKNPRRWKKML